MPNRRFKAKPNTACQGHYITVTLGFANPTQCNSRLYVYLHIQFTDSNIMILLSHTAGATVLHLHADRNTSGLSSVGKMCIIIRSLIASIVVYYN